MMIKHGPAEPNVTEIVSTVDQEKPALECTAKQEETNWLVTALWRIKAFFRWWFYQKWQDTNLVAHAKEELKRAGLMDKGSVYDGMLGKEALRLIKTFSGQGHSGMSAYFTVQIFDKLAAYKPLTPITNDPTEWMQVSEPGTDHPAYWQCRRQYDLFSDDGLKTCYSVDDKERVRKPLYSAAELKAQEETKETTTK